jgi:hypothetical protein
MSSVVHEKQVVAERRALPNEPIRVKKFAAFFKSYMSISAVVAAALPIPVTSLKLIPTYKVQTSLLSTYTSLFCFLLLGFIFYSRHSLARLMFPEVFGKTAVAGSSKRGRHFSGTRSMQFLVGILPALLILSSLGCVFAYHSKLDYSLAKLTGSATPEVAGRFPDTTAALLQAQSLEIPEGTLLMIFYLGIFLFAESAFIVMALKEYLQDLLKVSELDLVAGPRASGPSETGAVAVAEEPSRT